MKRKEPFRADVHVRAVVTSFQVAERLATTTTRKGVVVKEQN